MSLDDSELQVKYLFISRPVFFFLENKAPYERLGEQVVLKALG